MLFIGIDIGGTKIAGAAVSAEGEVSDLHTRATPAHDSEATVQAVIEIVHAVAAGREITALGVAAPGFIDADQSVVYYAPNLSWRNYPLRDRLREEFGSATIVVDNDASAAGWAEHRFGVGAGAGDMVMLTLGTGVGGAIVTDGRLVRGGFGAASELGHMRVVPNGRLCGCGASGCLEQYASGRALQRLAAVYAGESGEELAASIGTDGRVPGDALAAAIASRQPAAIRALTEVGGWIGQACASFSVVLDPRLFVIGGGVAASGAPLLDAVRQAYHDHLPARGFHPEPEFAIAEFVNNSGVAGAGDLARVAHERVRATGL